jgi:hypothetical protein
MRTGAEMVTVENSTGPNEELHNLNSPSDIKKKSIE